MYLSLAMGLPAWVIKAMDKKRRAFLWRGTDTVHGGHCLVAWNNVCCPIELGDLGITDLRAMGYAMRLRWEWLRKAEPSQIWTELPAVREPTVSAMFQASVFVEVGNGERVLF